MNETSRNLTFVLVLTLCYSMAAKAQNESSLSSRLIGALQTKEPDWKPITTIQNRVPLVPSEKTILAAVWTRRKSSQTTEQVDTSIYGVENAEQAAAWLRPFRTAQVAPGWHISIYRIGDEGYLAKYKDGKRFEIQFRRGKTVSKIAANDLEMAREFAKVIVGQIPAD
jgi:hypothetical protein